MSDIVVTVPKNFRYGNAPKGLAAWLSEGDAPGEAWSGEFYNFSTWGFCPKLNVGERVYIVCNGQLVGYAPLVEMWFDGERIENGKFRTQAQARIELIRGPGAVACTIQQPITGFRGWRYRWWDYGEETPLDLSAYLPATD